MTTVRVRLPESVLRLCLAKALVVGSDVGAW